MVFDVFSQLPQGQSPANDLWQALRPREGSASEEMEVAMGLSAGQADILDEDYREAVKCDSLAAALALVHSSCERAAVDVVLAPALVGWLHMRWVVRDELASQAAQGSTADGPQAVPNAPPRLDWSGLEVDEPDDDQAKDESGEEPQATSRSQACTLGLRQAA